MVQQKVVEVPDIRMKIKKIFVFEFEDALFHHDSAVLLPSQPAGSSSKDGAAPSPTTLQVEGLSAIVDIYKFLDENPNKKLIIIGNTDTTGRAGYNFNLSMLRASSVLYLLEGEKENWAENSDTKYKIEDVQQILKHYANKWGWDCDPGKINDKMTPETKKAIRQFQTYTKINVNGIIGKQTWEAIFDCYIVEIADLLKITPKELNNYRSKIEFYSDKNKILACGETRPIEAARKNDYRSQTNRRVELFFIDSNEKIGIKCPDPMSPYPYGDKTCNLHPHNCPFASIKAPQFLQPKPSPTVGLLYLQLVTDGAILMCSFGTTPSGLVVIPETLPSSLVILPEKTVITSNKPVATIMDNKPMVNIPPFGMCNSPTNPQVAAATAAAMGALTPQPCIPVTSSPWTPGSSTVMIGNLPALNSTSRCMCAYGGVITVTAPG